MTSSAFRTQLTDAGLAQLIEQCPELHPNKLISSQKGNKFLTSVCKTRSAITEINLRGCKAVTDAGLADLVMECPELEPDAILSQVKSDHFCEAVMEHRPRVKSLNLWKKNGPLEHMRVGFKSCYTTMKMEPADNVDNGMLVGGGRSGTYTAALGIDMKPKSGVHRFEFKPNLMSNGAIGIATNDQPLGTSPTQYNSTFMIYFWLNGDAFCYCKNRSRQTFKFATYKAGDNVRFILDRHEEDTTELTVEINDKQVYNFASLENIGMPKGTVLCPYAYIQYNDKLALLHTQKSRRPFAVGDAKLAVLLEKCTQLLPDTLLSEEKGDKFCEAVVKHVCVQSDNF